MSHQWELIRYKVYAELRAEAARAYLGVFWWVFEPLLYLAAFYVVFGLVFQRGGEGFVAVLLTGLVVWKWFDSSVRTGAGSILVARGLMQQVYMPKFIFPSIVILTNFIKFLLILCLLLGFLLIYGVPAYPTWLGLPLLVGVQFLLIGAIAGILAAVVPFVPDIQIIIGNALTLLFFLSGIFFSVKDLSEQMQTFFYLNPMAVLIEAYRNLLIEGVWPHWGRLGAVVLFSLLGILAAWTLLRRFDRRYPKLAL